LPQSGLEPDTVKPDIRDIFSGCDILICCGIIFVTPRQDSNPRADLKSAVLPIAGDMTLERGPWTENEHMRLKPAQSLVIPVNHASERLPVLLRKDERSPE
jgi:hypothetical protein